jgi:cytochrome P450
LGFLRDCALECGDLVPLRFFGKRILFVNHPDAIAQVLAAGPAQVTKGIVRRSDRLLLGEGITLREGAAWRSERRLIQPAFHRERQSAYGAAVVALAERLLACWRGGEVRDLAAEMGALTLTVIGQALLGLGAEDATALAGAFGAVVDGRAAHARSPSMLLPPQWPTPANLRLRRARRLVDRVIQRAIDRRRGGAADGDDLLSLLLRARDAAGRPLPDGQVLDEVRTILVGGHETIANLLAWIWYLLAQHPEVEARLLAEVARAGGAALDPGDLPRLPYAEAVIAETLRLYPPAPVLTRVAIADLVIGGYPVTAGTELVVSPWVQQRDPRYFAEPERFLPARWAGDLASRLPRYAYFPFGGGPRVCLGKSFATLQASLVVATILPQFHCALVSDRPVVADPIPTLHPRGGLPMQLERRTPTVVDGRNGGPEPVGAIADIALADSGIADAPCPVLGHSR